LQALRHLDLPATEQIRIATEFSAPGQPTDARVAAVAYLGVLASEQRRALDRLLDLAGDDTYDVRQAAIVALERVNDPRAAEALATRLAEEPEPKLRERLREAGQKWAHSFAP
jgi:HEAT repeat protein